MVYGRRKNNDNKLEKNLKKLDSIILDVVHKYFNEKNIRIGDNIYTSDIINIKNQIEYIINMDRKLKFTYKKSNFDLYHHLAGSIHFYDNKIRKSNDINKYLNYYHKVDILINGKNNNNLIEN